MNLQVIVPPEGEPITVVEAKKFMRVGFDDDDEIIAGLITTAREMLEAKLNVAMLEQTVTEEFDGGKATIRLARSPVVETIEVMFHRADATTEIITAGMFDRGGNRLKYRYGWPVIQPSGAWPMGRGFAALVITYAAGYPDTQTLPSGLKTALKQLTAYLYEHRGDEIADIPKEIMQTCKQYYVPIDLIGL